MGRTTNTWSGLPAPDCPRDFVSSRTSYFDVGFGNEPDDQANFTEQLTDALTDHRAYWSANEARSDTPRGFVSLPLLGPCAMAFDEGITIDVESDYLPIELIQNPPWMFELD